MRVSRQRARRVLLLGIGRVSAVASGLIVPVLSRVEDDELGEVAVRDASVQQHVRALRHRGTSQGHVLVVGLVGSGPAAQERLRRRCLASCLGNLVGVVVLDLVVVPGNGPREGRMCRLEVLVGSVLGVAVAVVARG